MKRVRMLVASLMVAIAVNLLLSSWAFARVVTAPTSVELPTSPIIITGYQVIDGELGYVQLYNPEDEPVNVDDWKLEYTNSLSSLNLTITGLYGWIEPGAHVVIGNASMFGSDIALTFMSPNVGGKAISIALVPDDLYRPMIQPISASTTSPMQRGKTSAGNYSSSSTFKELTTDLYSDMLYRPQDAADLQIEEILPHSRDCDPADTGLACNDYVKIRIGDQFDISQSELFRVRIGHKTSSSTVSNTISLVYGVASGNFLLLNLRNDGEYLSLSDEGNYIWIEDKYGIQKYDTTTVQYPNASSTTKIGWSWALDDTSQWVWSSTPSPTSENIITFPQPEEVDTSKEDIVAPCPEGKYRNPATNRCKNIEITSSLTPCSPGQQRNPATNRCRTVLSTSSPLIPCKPNQQRNPLTNRCRMVTTANASLVPCKPGYARNPETNRCRKVLGVTEPGSSPVVLPAVAQPFGYGGVVLGLTGIAALSYGMYEWRREVATAVRKLVTIISGY